MVKRVLLAWMFIVAGAFCALAQDAPVWIQIEAQPNLNAATDRARAYASDLPDVNGFSLGAGWYGVALGPYARTDAEEVLRVYRAEGAIPRDSYIVLGSSFGQQFWPVGANVLSQGAVTAPSSAPATGPDAADTAVNTAAPEPADETRAQAQRSERLLSRAEREALQIALQWAGTYSGAIDGAFGRGTRGSMAAWQTQKGFDPTGILTTRQRAVLLQDYNAVLDDLVLGLVADSTAGIEMILPIDVVQFEKYEYPFAHYTMSGEIEATVLLISQAGDQNTLFGLYDIMQTLDIVPLDGPRERKERAFTLVGEDATRISETRVSLENGAVKGFTLVWPAGDEDRRSRLLAEMDKSFRRIEGVIPVSASTQEQAIDLISGLDVRTPRLSRSGFFVDSRGTVLTTTEAIDSCSRITLDGEAEAEVIYGDDARGVAVVTPKTALAPRAFARFADVQPRLNSEVVASGFSYEGVLDAPSVTYGALNDVRGLNGEENLARLALRTLPGDAGGPVLDAGGGVLGMLLPNAQSGRALPEDVRFALNGEALQEVLSLAGLAAGRTDSGAAIDPIDLTAAATAMTVLVSCWD